MSQIENNSSNFELPEELVKQLNKSNELLKLKIKKRIDFK